MTTISKKMVNEFTKNLAAIADKIHREGGDIRIEMDQRWRTIHFAPGMSREFIYGRMVGTVEVLKDWV